MRFNILCGGVAYLSLILGTAAAPCVKTNPAQQMILPDSICVCLEDGVVDADETMESCFMANSNYLNGKCYINGVTNLNTFRKNCRQVDSRHAAKCTSPEDVTVLYYPA
ncbi:hypothetical protein RhiJN_01336 [Ceratobasidium sp. AG-Ba]|nr:hypothetical protein RhiJN_01336 [Ceratobasidium sp. AG-Ba]QRW02362.1 hypothetical protein RhiLY_01360 [Ceratobasidium sp. AG-Ba]